MASSSFAGARNGNDFVRWRVWTVGSSADGGTLRKELRVVAAG